MKPTSYYTTPHAGFEKPNREQFVMVYVYSLGRTIFTGTEKEYDLAKDRLDKEVPHIQQVIQRQVDDLALRAAHAVHQQHMSGLRTEFNNDLFADCGVTEHPRRADVLRKAEYIANEFGDGKLGAIEEIFTEIVSLIK